MIDEDYRCPDCGGSVEVRFYKGHDYREFFCVKDKTYVGRLPTPGYEI